MWHRRLDAGQFPSDAWRTGYETVTASLAGELARLLGELLSNQTFNLVEQLENVGKQTQHGQRIFDEAEPYSYSTSERAGQIFISELLLWRRQAEAIGRSQSHLKAIDNLLQLTQERQTQVLDISERTYHMRCRDLEEFNEQAFRLMQLHLPLKRLGDGQGKVRVWWQEIKIEVQRVASRVAKRIYNLIR